MMILVPSFFITALLYSIVGFGGGSSYIAILAVSHTPFDIIPEIALFCNLLVVTGGCYHFWKNGHVSKKLTLPFVTSSIPMSFLGGLFPLKERTFFLLLTLSLFLSGLRLLFLRDRKIEEIKGPSIMLSTMVGCILGLISGMVGIGGGIFLSPILINMGWARAKDAAAVASFFILMNSIAGLAGQLTKDFSLHELSPYFPLFLTVMIAGQIGSRIGTHSKISYSLVQKGTGILILAVTLRLLLKLFSNT